MGHEPSEQGRTKRAYVRRPDGRPQSRAELKRRHRANKAAREGRVRNPRLCKEGKPHEAHVIAWRLYLAEEVRAMRLWQCDAHVRRYSNVMKDRLKAARNYRRDPDARYQYQTKRKQALPDAYVRQNLLAQGFSQEAIDAHLINLKRESIGLRRLKLEIKQAVASLPKDEHETISQHA